MRRHRACGASVPRSWGPLTFSRTRIEDAYRIFHAQKHSQLDPLGFAFALAWCTVAVFRLGALLSTVQLAALTVLAADAAAAAALQQLAPAAYLRHRNVIICSIRLALVATAAAAQPLAVRSWWQSGGASLWAFALLAGGQHLLLAFCTVAWRLRTQWHLPLQLSCLCVAAAGNRRLLAAVLSEPAAASALAFSIAALWPALAAAVSPATAFAALCTVLQVQLGFHGPSSMLYTAEVQERSDFLSMYMLQTAVSFQSGSYALGMRRASRSDGSLDRLMQRLSSKP